MCKSSHPVNIAAPGLVLKATSRIPVSLYWPCHNVRMHCWEVLFDLFRMNWIIRNPIILYMFIYVMPTFHTILNYLTADWILTSLIFHHVLALLCVSSFIAYFYMQYWRKISYTYRNMYMYIYIYAYSTICVCCHDGPFWLNYRTTV